MQSSEPGTRHALDAEALFAPADEAEETESGEEDSGSPLDSGDEGREFEEDLNLNVCFLR